jgi:diguanylate cyclase (GGDEF)-like protein
MAQDAASDLEAASDYLTDRVRSFAVTGDLENLEDFFKEIDVSRRRDSAVSTLEDLLENNDSDAYNYLVSALSISNQLVEREYLAMKFVVESGEYPEDSIPDVIRQLELSPEEQQLLPDQKRARAVDLVFEDEYMEAKAQIKENTALCTEDLIANMDRELTASNAAMERLIKVHTVLTVLLFVVVFFMALFISFWVRIPLIRMVENMKAKQLVQPSGAKELRFVAHTYNEIFEENQQTNERLMFDAMHDALTGLLNRNAYQVLEPDIDIEHSALLIVDVDNFKSVNDIYGHQTGDRILKRVAGILQNGFRSTDMIFRIGGDEFVIIMTRANSTMRELVLSKIEQMNVLLQNPEDDLPPVSLSVGVAFGDRENPQGDLLKDADTALYRVKNAGRSGCVIY